MSKTKRSYQVAYPMPTHGWSPTAAVAQPQTVADHAEHSAWVAEITGSDKPFDPRPREGRRREKKLPQAISFT